MQLCCHHQLVTASNLPLRNGIASIVHSYLVYSDFALFASTSLQLSQPYPLTKMVLIKWCALHHNSGRLHSKLEQNLAVPKVWHIHLGLSIACFNSDHLEGVLHSYGRFVGTLLPSDKLPITLLLVRHILQVLSSVCTFSYDRHMFQAASCLVFACLFCTGEPTCRSLLQSLFTIS